MTEASSRYAHMSNAELISALEAHDRTFQSFYNTIHLSNSKMAPGEKLFWIGTYCILPAEQPDENGLVRLPTDKVAEFIGMSESSVGRYANAVIERFDATKVPVPYTTLKGQECTLTYVDRTEPVWREPWNVELPEEKERIINGNGKQCPRCKTFNLQITTRRIKYQEIQECECCGYKKVSSILDDNEPLTPMEYIPPKKGPQPEEPFADEAEPEREAEKGPQPEEPFAVEDEKLENLHPLPEHTRVAVPVLAAVYRNPALLPELKKKCTWAVGRATWNEKMGKWDKKPFIADLLGTRGASHSDPATWRSFECAMAVYEKSQAWEGRAEDDKGPFHFLMPACDGTFTFTDGDHCRDPETGIITPEALKRARRINTYTEPSYGKEGVHHLSWGSVPAGRKNEKLGVEMYSRTRFIALTGQPLPEFPQMMEHRQDEVNALYKELFPPKPDPLWDLPEGDDATDEELAHVLEAARNATNAAKFHRLMAGDASDYPHKNGTPDYSRADQALCTMFVYWCRRVLQKASKEMIDWLFRKSKLCDAKWERQDYRDSTIAQAFAYVGVAA